MDGRVIGLKTPAVSHDAAEIKRRIPQEQQPDLVIVRADATLRGLPRNLGVFRCPKVLLVGDTHYLGSPLRGVIGYALSEPFGHIVLERTRHHAHWFARAGLRGVHWLPAVGIGFPYGPTRRTRSRPLTFAGGTGHAHARLQAVLTAVRRAGLPLETPQCTTADAACCLAESELTLNVSLNGEIAPRVYEALASGALLLTDDLPEESGLRLLFQPGRHLDVWRSTDELVDKIRHHLSHSTEADRIRREGCAEVYRSHSPRTKARELLDLVFSGVCNPRYDLGSDELLARSLAPTRVEPERIAHLAQYEWIQEVHRLGPAVAVYCSADVARELREQAGLPRLTVRTHGELAPAPLAPPGAAEAAASELLWLDDAGTGFAQLLCRFTGSLVIAPNTAAARLAEWGFHASSRADNGFGLFKLAHPATFLGMARDAGANETVRALMPGVLASASCAQDCLLVAECARSLGDAQQCLSALHRAVALDRACQPALLQLASMALGGKDPAFAAMALEEARRFGPLPPSSDRIRIHLAEGQAEKLRPYYSLAGRLETERTDAPRRILVVTNLFPPQELGGYGRMIWEFARGLRARGHAVRVLAGDAEYLAKPPSDDERDMERSVARKLRLSGRWADGRIHTVDRLVRAGIEAANAATVLREADEFEPDLMLLGNLDLLGVDLVHEALQAGCPVLHAVANREPGYSPACQPRSPSYWIAPCSDWNGKVLSEAGYRPARMATVYPGARIDRFYRAFPADSNGLRIAYASIVAPYKGAHVLVEALARLNALGIAFTAEIAGEALDPAYADKLRDYCARNGLAGRVSFPGFLGREGLASLFARSNVLVFPSQFAEPFGISQVEAMASGLVVITSGTGGAAEVVRDGLDGLVYKADDAAALSGRLRMLALERGLFQRLQAASQRRALGFSVDAAVRRIEALSAELTQSALPSSCEQPANDAVSLAASAP